MFDHMVQGKEYSIYLVNFNYGFIVVWVIKWTNWIGDLKFPVL